MFYISLVHLIAYSILYCITPNRMFFYSHLFLFYVLLCSFFQIEWDLPSRQWLAVTSILLITAAAGVAVPLALRVSAGAPFEERLEVATQLLESVPLIDGHNDLPWNIRKFLHNKLNDFQ